MLQQPLAGKRTGAPGGSGGLRAWLGPSVPSSPTALPLAASMHVPGLVGLRRTLAPHSDWSADR